MLETPLSPTPNLQDYAHCIRPGNKCNYQPKKVWNTPTWVETSIKAQWGGGPTQIQIVRGTFVCLVDPNPKLEALFLDKNLGTLNI